MTTTETEEPQTVRVGIIATDEDFAAWCESDTYKALIGTGEVEDAKVEVVQIRPGQAITGVTFRMVIAVSWDNASEGLGDWITEQVAVRLEPGGMIFYETSITAADIDELPDA